MNDALQAVMNFLLFVHWRYSVAASLLCCLWAMCLDSPAMENDMLQQQPSLDCKMSNMAERLAEDNSVASTCTDSDLMLRLDDSFVLEAVSELTDVAMHQRPLAAFRLPVLLASLDVDFSLNYLPPLSVS
jgi:hypothetical protein